MTPDFHFNNITVDTLKLPFLSEKKVTADVLRLDKIHSLISGNKWFKLRYYLEDAKQQGKKTIITFGGAWSNHILATAAACALYNFDCIGIIRGEESEKLSPTLVQAKKLNMQLVFISREDYAAKKIPAEVADEDHYLIKEGGFGMNGADGAATILDFCDKEKYTHIACAAGTGTMIAGLIKAATLQQQLIGISVLKNNMKLEENVQSLLPDNHKKEFLLLHKYHFGGYAKHTPALITFMNDFFQLTNIPTDFVYTARLFYGINDLLHAGFFEPGCSILLIHSGGLQGNSSLSKGTLIF